MGVGIPRRQRSLTPRWLLVGVYVVLLFLFLPFTPRLVVVIQEEISRSLFSILVSAAIIITSGAFLYFLAFRSKKHILRAVLLAGLILVVFCGSIVLLENPVERTHLIEYGILGGLLFWALGESFKGPRLILYAVGISFGIGYIDEVVQWLLPNRYYDIHDIVLNGLGGGLGVLTVWFSQSAEG